MGCKSGAVRVRSIMSAPDLIEQHIWPRVPGPAPMLQKPTQHTSRIAAPTPSAAPRCRMPGPPTTQIAHFVHSAVQKQLAATRLQTSLYVGPPDAQQQTSRSGQIMDALPNKRTSTVRSSSLEARPPLSPCPLGDESWHERMLPRPSLDSPQRRALRLMRRAQCKRAQSRREPSPHPQPQRKAASSCLRTTVQPRT